MEASDRVIDFSFPLSTGLMCWAQARVRLLFELLEHQSQLINIPWLFPFHRPTSPASVASFLLVSQLSASVLCFAANPGAPGLQCRQKSTRERLKIARQFWPHTKAATSSLLALYTKPKWIHQAGVLALAPYLSPFPSCYLCWAKAAKGGQTRDKKPAPRAVQGQIQRDLE